MNEVKKISWSEVCERMNSWAAYHPYSSRDAAAVQAVIVFDPVKSKWRKGKNYSLADCSYRINSGDKWWHGECCGSSLFATCLEPTSPDSNGIRLDCYLDSWKIAYCYMVADPRDAAIPTDKGAAA